MAPIGSFPADGENRPHPSRLVGVRIGGEELAIARERISLNSGGVCVLRRKTGYRSALGLRQRRSGGRRVGGALEDIEWTVKFGSAPRQQSPLCLGVDRNSRLIERLGDVHAPLPDCAGQGLAINAVRTFLVASQRSRRRVKGDQFAGLGIDQGKPRRERRTLSGVRIGARRIENDDARPPWRYREGVAEIGNSDRFNRHVGVAIDLRVDRNEIIVTVILNRAARKVDEGLHIGARRRRLLQKISQRGAQGLAVKIARANHVKTCGLQSLRD
jgi:hypothetical protein